MKIEEQVPLRTLTSLRVGGEARYVYTCESIEEVKEAVAFAKENNLPWYVLGGGTNVLARDEGYRGVIIRPDIRGITFTEEDDQVLVEVGAGEVWDTFVDEVGRCGLWGIENLAGIPGTVGASPVQNIGAYGTELKDIFHFAKVCNAETGAVERLEKDACAFAYRDSIFKHNKNLIVLSVAFLLRKDGTPQLSYKDLAKAKESGEDLSTPSKVAHVVRAIRAKKFPDTQTHGTAGSFFKNPIITTALYDTLTAKYGEIPSFPSVAGIKIPLAFVLDSLLQLRGYRKGTVWLYSAQPLVLVADAGSTQKDIDALADEVVEKVKTTTNIFIEREVQTLQEN